MKTHLKALGFTLVELLMVIAVIALLAGLLLPTLSKAKEKGRQASSIGNAGQIVKGIMLFAFDNRNKLPGYNGSDSSGMGVMEIAYDFEPNGKTDSPIDYIRDPRVFQSPADRGCSWPSSYDHVWEDTGGDANDEKYGSSYAYPGTTGSRGVQSIDDATDGSFRMTTISNSTAKILVFEPTLGASQFSGTTPIKKNNWYTSRHGGGVAGFLDGHAEMIRTNAPSVNSSKNGYY